MTLADRHMQDLATPALYRNIIIPRKEEEHEKHQKSAARLVRTLSGRPSLAVLVRGIENAPCFIWVRLLERILFEHADPLGSQNGSLGESTNAITELHHLPVDVMKICVNLQSLSVVGQAPPVDASGTWRWLNFLLNPNIKLKNLRVWCYPRSRIPRASWGFFVAKVLDVQSSLEYLDYSFDNQCPKYGADRVNSWAPELQVLAGNYIGGLRALLSTKRSIGTLVVRSVPMRDFSLLCADQLKTVDTLKEIIYQGPVEDEQPDLLELFGAMPTSLRIFRGEMWLNFPTEDDLFQELLTAFVLTPNLIEFGVVDLSSSCMGFFEIDQASIFHADTASHEEERLQDQGMWLARYAEICPGLRAFTFPDGKQWSRANGWWIYRGLCSRGYFNG
ncbi:hypothetical protein FRC01_005691 [Tulasnella sp. 417]|nr:hypothetical protein FRC01_005691 [Tulasnella sp. 417]